MTENQNQNLSQYQLLKRQNVVNLLKPLLLQAGFYLRDVDGKIDVAAHTGWDTPWHHVKHAHWADCGHWHKIIFDVVQEQLGTHWPPSECQHCWKVVVRPKTLEQLFQLLALQQHLGLPAKCGIELRDSVGGLYGGYFYNRGLELGGQCYQFVRGQVNNWKGLGPEVEVFLKRACTEYELTCGPSDQWIITQEQLEVEGLINQWVVRDNALRTQPPHVLASIHQRWIEWAYAHGDETYRLFTNGEPIYRPYVQYQKLTLEKNFLQKARDFDQGKILLSDVFESLEVGKNA